jgi:hypothetical protein
MLAIKFNVFLFTFWYRNPSPTLHFKYLSMLRGKSSRSLQSNSLTTHYINCQYSLNGDSVLKPRTSFIHDVV